MSRTGAAGTLSPDLATNHLTQPMQLSSHDKYQSTAWCLNYGGVLITANTVTYTIIMSSIMSCIACACSQTIGRVLYVIKMYTTREKKTVNRAVAPIKLAK